MSRTHADVVALLDADAVPQPLVIEGVSAASAPRPRTLSFVRTWTDEAAATVRGAPTTVFLVPRDAAGDDLPHVIGVDNPGLAYARAARALFMAPAAPGVHPTAVVDPSATLGADVSVGPLAVIGPGVSIGDRSVVRSHAVLEAGVTIGADSTVGTHTSIGHHGFGFEVDADGTPLRLPHVGGVVIGDRVEIGSHVTIAQGTIEPTVIEDDVKIDDAVFVAHNVHVGAASFLIAGAQVSGSVRIGKRTWISPEATLINKITVGDDALVGIGAVVVRDVEANTVVAGVPARPRGPRHEQSGG